MIRFRHALLAVPLACAALAQAAAQSAPQMMSGDNMTAGVKNRGSVPLPPKAAPPPALPGARSVGGPAAAQRPPSELSPNEALFDGVNRGDIVAVRDALSRGADLNAPNVLGITATEAAIDLGRNDIAFLLLSLRGADKSRSAQGAARPAQGNGQGADPRRPVQQASAPAAAPRPAPRQPVFPSDAVAPAPDRGFLGYGR